MLKVKKVVPVLCAAILTITLAGCSYGKDIHQKIHDKFYMMKDYTSECTLTVMTSKNKTSYDFTCNYKSSDNSFEIVYDDITVRLSDSSAKITKNDTVLDVPVKDEDMLILLNTFFKSYYEGEESVQKTSGTQNSGTTVLSCTLMTPTKYGTQMKLWIDNKTVNPKKMQVSDGENVTLEVKYNTFEFIK